MRIERMNPKSMAPMLRCVLIGLFVVLIGCAKSPHDVAGSDDKDTEDTLRAMLERDREIVNARNDMDKTPLHFAVTYGRDDNVKILLDAKADPKAQDQTGMTPLHCAATLDRVDEAELLLKAGADLEAKDSFGDTPLHSAAMHGKIHMIDWLHEKGANFNALNADGKSALDLAKREHKTEAAERIAELVEN